MVALRDRIELIPLADDPVDGLQTAVGDSFDGVSIQEIRHTARAAAEKEVEAKFAVDSEEY